MERWIGILLALLLGGLLPSATDPRQPEDTAWTYSYLSVQKDESQDTGQTDTPYLRAVWLSQFDMQPIYRDGNRQRAPEDFRALCRTICRTLQADGFNTVFLQLRPNGDSLYESQLYPLSKYVAGAYGESIAYDAVGLFLEEAADAGIAVHGWINPLRLVTVDEMQQIPTGYAVRDWYDRGSGQVKEYDGRLYLDPSYPEVRELIAAGASEILQTYDLAGIHMDDYFYPTTDKTFDRREFLQSGFDDLGDFRRDNLNRLVQLLFDTVHRQGADKQFGISPAGNLDSLADGYFADAKRWCAEPGYIDYILPQLYFGFENAYCPFDVMVNRWADTVCCDTVTLYIGLDAAKAVLGAQGEQDAFAGTVEGKTEWIRKKDILSRSLNQLYQNRTVQGYCFFSYSYLYDRFTGEVVPEIREEYDRFAPLLQHTP